MYVGRVTEGRRHRHHSQQEIVESEKFVAADVVHLYHLSISSLFYYKKRKKKNMTPAVESQKQEVHNKEKERKKGKVQSAY
jgi:hypothetical protein